MKNIDIYVMTGITSGLGLAAAQRIAEKPNTLIITGVRSEDSRAAIARAIPSEKCQILDIDQTSLVSVRAFIDQVNDMIQERSLKALVLNAGIQITSGLEVTPDGIETTFMVNHLSHWMIHEGLKDSLVKGSRVILTGSGTHDPDDPVAKKFGFRGGLFPSADALVSGELDETAAAGQQCLDRYATSKLCNIMMVLALSKSNLPATYVAYDPGLMPGTDLARDRGAVERFAWYYIMPFIGPIMKGVSNSNKSGAVLADLALGKNFIADGTPINSGVYVEFSKKKLLPSSLARNKAKQDQLTELSRSLAMT